MSHAALYVAPVRLLAGGQSHQQSPVGFAIPDVTCSRLGIALSNLSSGGASWTTLLTTVHQLGRVLQDRDRGDLITVVLLIGGTQDILLGDTGEQVYDDIVAYADALRAYSDKDISIIACTIPPIDLFGHFTPAEEAERIAHNALLMANADSKFDFVVDITVPPYDDPTGPMFAVDQTHFSVEGAEGIATDLVMPAVVSAIEALSA